MILGTGAPAAPGETIVLYATGLGVVTPALVPGVVPTDALPVVAPTQVTIAGAPATLSFAGLVPGTAGVYQLNVQVPSDAAAGDLPVIVTSGSVSSAPLLLTVGK